MAEKRVGDTTLRELAPAFELDPQFGRRAIRRFEGFMQDLDVQAQIFMAAGFTVSIDPIQGQWARMYVRAPQTTEPNQPPVDTWERSTELVQDDIRNNPKLLVIVGDAWNLNFWYNDAKAKIKAQTTATAFNYADTNRQAFFELLSRGADAYLVRRHVLRRRRIISGRVPAESTVGAVEKFYSTTRLITTFAIPAQVADALPVAGPDTPANTAWGWMERMDTSIVTPAYAQTEEVKDWVFAAWTTLLYEYVP